MDTFLMFIIFMAICMKKVRNKYSFCYVLFFVLGFSVSKAQKIDYNTPLYSNYENKLNMKDSSFSIEGLRDLLSQLKFNEIRISINRHWAFLPKSIIATNFSQCMVFT